jgi:hypothetical protein
MVSGRGCTSIMMQGRIVKPAANECLQSVSVVMQVRFISPNARFTDFHVKSEPLELIANRQCLS